MLDLWLSRNFNENKTVKDCISHMYLIGNLYFFPVIVGKLCQRAIIILFSAWI